MSARVSRHVRQINPTPPRTPADPFCTLAVVRIAANDHSSAAPPSHVHPDHGAKRTDRPTSEATYVFNEASKSRESIQFEEPASSVEWSLKRVG